MMRVLEDVSVREIPSKQKIQGNVLVVHLKWHTKISNVSVFLIITNLKRENVKNAKDKLMGQDVEQLPYDHRLNLLQSLT